MNFEDFLYSNFSSETISIGELKGLVDYYNASQPIAWTNYLSIIAIIVSIVAIHAARKQAKETFKQTQSAERGHIRNEWNGIVDACLQSGHFIDISYTSNYKNSPATSRLVYEAFCYKVWSLVDYIIQNNFQEQNPYNAILQWSAAFHRDWLQDNPYMFASSQFWVEYDKIRAEPLTVFRNPILPQVDAKPAIDDPDRYGSDNIDWNLVHQRYHDYVISPWAPKMTEKDKSTGLVRNELLNYLNEYGEDGLRELRIIDFGCGPGNLIEHLSGRVSEIYGLDLSKKALEIAKAKAEARGIKFHPIHTDMRDFVSEQKFDLIISVNSILPATREDISKIFQSVRRNLAPHGKLISILPSYDTCEALMNYWKNVYKKRAERQGAETDFYVSRCVEALRAAKKMDSETLGFADDGVHVQCLHTPVSIRRDFAESGLKLIGEMKKVQYPWEYAREFDYGYFPDEEEIWDWFVKAER